MRWVGWLALALAVAVGPSSVLSEAGARPGGGQTFSSGSKSSGGSSGGSRSSGSSRSTSGSSSWGSSSKSDSPTWSSKPSYSSPFTESTRTSYGGGSSRSTGSRGYSGSSTEFFFFIIVGVVLVTVGVVAFRWFVRQSEEGWESSLGAGSWRDRFDEAEAEIASEREKAEQHRHRHESIDRAIAALQGKDESFSFIVFEDFLYALFTEVHTARGGGRLALLAPYLRPKVIEALSARQVDAVTTVVVGSMTIEDVRALEDDRRVQVTARFVANYTEKHGDAETSWYAEEVWVLSKSADAKSRPPDKARVLGCPSCGAALPKEVAAKCKYCSAPADSDVYDWIVEGVAEAERTPRGPMLTGTTEEVGTSLPTVVAPDAPAKFEELRARDPEFSWSAFTKRVELVFSTFHAAWSSQELAPVRPFLSDALFETQQYWVATYKAQGLRNVTEEPRIVGIYCARVASDKYFDAVTVRVFASAIDYTVDAKGTVVGGNKSKVREYSEYWTFIRAAGNAGAPRSEPGCPNCGAPTSDINMAGRCSTCGVKMTMGEFDWVLSRIQQDEVYA